VHVQFLSPLEYLPSTARRRPSHLARLFFLITFPFFIPDARGRKARIEMDPREKQAQVVRQRQKQELLDKAYSQLIESQLKGIASKKLATQDDEERYKEELAKERERALATNARKKVDTSKELAVQSSGLSGSVVALMNKEAMSSSDDASSPSSNSSSRKRRRKKKKSSGRDSSRKEKKKKSGKHRRKSSEKDDDEKYYEGSSKKKRRRV